jgi:hypothetical protein
MSPAPLLLGLLILAMPVATVIDGAIVHGLIVAAAALLIAIIALRIRSNEVGFMASVARPMIVVAIVPVLWILFQVIPLKSLGLANPIWESAAAALGHPVLGTISIDPGVTLVSLAWYLSAVAIALAAAAVALDRRRAAWVYSAILAATMIIAVMTLVAKFGPFALAQNVATRLPNTGTTDCAALGVIFALGAALRKFEHDKPYGPDQNDRAGLFWPIIALYIFAAVICLAAIVVGATNKAVFAVFCGIAILAAVPFIRRYRLGPWGYAAIISAALVVAIAAVALQPGKRINDLTLAFSAPAPAPLIAVTQRILAETSLSGTGAGTFFAVLPMYRDIDQLNAGDRAPTAAAAISVEMGRPFLWAAVVALLHDALSRRRDWIYSTSGASCVVATTLLAFTGAGLFGTAPTVVVASAIGIAVAQRKSRSAASPLS